MHQESESDCVPRVVPSDPNSFENRLHATARREAEIERLNSELAAMRQRAEEAEAKRQRHGDLLAKELAAAVARAERAEKDREVLIRERTKEPEMQAVFERAIAAFSRTEHTSRCGGNEWRERAERAEERQRIIIDATKKATMRIYVFADGIVNNSEDARACEAAGIIMAEINGLDAVLSSPPADASTMGGKSCDTCQHDPETCDRAECPAWGKSEEGKARILTREANRPLNNEEHAIVDAGYERGKRILAEVKAEEREMQYMEALAAYANDEDRYNRGEGEPYGSIQVEVGVIARQARAALAEMEQKS